MRQYLLPYLKKDAVILLLYQTMIKRIYPPHIHIFCICISFFLPPSLCSPSKSRACPCSVSPLGGQTRIKGKIKASLRVPREAVGLPYRKHKERRNAVAFSSARYRPVEISYVSLGDRFAAMQIVMVTKRLLHPMSVLLSY